MNPVWQALHHYLEAQDWHTLFSEPEYTALQQLCEAQDFEPESQFQYWSQLLVHWDQRNLSPHRSVHNEVLAILNTYLMALHTHHQYPMAQLEPLRWRLAETQVDLQQKSLLFWRFEHDQVQERLAQLSRENSQAQAEFYTLTELAEFLSVHIDDREQMIYHGLDALQGIMGADQAILCFQPESPQEPAHPYLFQHGQLHQASSPLFSQHPLWEQAWKSIPHQARSYYCMEDPSATEPLFPTAEILLWQVLSLSGGQRALLIVSAQNPYTFHNFHTWFTLAGVHLAGALNNATLNSQLNEMAIRDGLMGIYNRRYLEQRLQEAFKVSERYQRPLSVLMVDIDHFKGVNDRYGHPIGDEVLKWVSQSLDSRLRTTDILGRYGGEEFLILLPETDLQGAVKLAQNLVTRIAALPADQLAEGLQITVSIGVSSYPEQVQSAESLVSVADQHLYQAKKSGRNRYTAGEGSVIQ